MLGLGDISPAGVEGRSSSVIKPPCSSSALISSDKSANACQFAIEVLSVVVRLVGDARREDDGRESRWLPGVGGGRDSSRTEC